MIQRIQSVYLLLATIAVAVAAFMPIGQFTGIEAAATYAFKPLGVPLPDGGYQSTWGLFGLLLLAAIVELCTIFLYRARMLQVRMTIFASLLLVGFYIAFAAFFFILKGGLFADEATFRIGWALCLPLVGLILNYLAFRGIYRDELLVRAIDRLR